LRSDFSLPVGELLAAADEHTKLMFICSPNNPSGNIFPIEAVRELLDNFKGILVVDEAYIDFASQPSLTTLLSEYPNLVVLQTLSKAYGLAGLRLGLAFAHRDIMALFANVKSPYNINLAGMERAKELLARDVKSEIELIKSERDRVAVALGQMECVKKVYPSDANFLLVQVSDAVRLYNALIAEKVIVRDRSKVKGCSECLRITIGTPAENDAMLAVVKNWK
jgi:histidinol-phosphate aminotransferase